MIMIHSATPQIYVSPQKIVSMFVVSASHLHL